MLYAADNKDLTRVAAGLKAAIHNPNVSDEAKDRAADRLEDIDNFVSSTHKRQDKRQGSDEAHETNRSLGGYKATLSSEIIVSIAWLRCQLTVITDPLTSEGAKAHAREVLEAAGYTFERDEGVSEDEHMMRVLAGYKAALHSESDNTNFIYASAHCVFATLDPNVGPEAKEHAREFLKEHDAL